ncbi:monocarboxylate transporter 5 isoform X1 [Strongylocentrotus purpuratus]|uniref:Major facilitator superfamily (MFS) profile domain-containing protein n=1 Tax=Strongylocentrotus purpuratus TaxID=7668 RepID=A0A7M7NNJ7_STRPU|nr:monocarboxylate transporter 5 isoform X1 [Strongylocentrotus purpuratus]XP_030839120.1 monocarboxylate transporter 5 isoform X1 [Strongylocentrotus purpuratus]
MKGEPGSHFNRSGWTMAMAAFIHLTFTYGIISSFVVLFVSLEEEFESSAVATGWMGSMAWGVAAMFSPFSALMFLRWGHRPIALLGVLCCSVGLLVTSFLSNLWYMYVSFGFVFAAGTNMLNNPAFHLTALHFPGKKGVRPFAFVNLSGGVAILAGAPLIDVCIKSLGWRITYAIFSGILFVVCLPLCYFYKIPSASHSNLNEEEMKYTDCKPDGASNSTKDIGHGHGLVQSSSFVCLAKETCEHDAENERELENETETTTRTSHQYKQLAERDETSSSGVRTCFCNHQRRHVDSKPKHPSSQCELEDLSCAQGKTAYPDVGSSSIGVVEDSDRPRDAMEVNDCVFEAVDESCLDRKCAFMKVPGLWMATFGTMTTSAASVFNVINLVSYMQLIGLNDRTSVLLIMGIGLAEMFGRIVYFLIGSSLPVAGMTTMSAVNLAGAALSLCLALIPRLETIITYIIVAGIARGIFYTINLPSCLELFKGLDSAVVIAWMMVGNGFGGLLSSTCGGLSVDITGSYKVAFFTCAGLYFTSFLIFGSLRLWPRMFIKDKFTTPRN